MKEKSFLLFKPNQYSMIDVYQYIIKQLHENNLNIEKEYSIQLTSEQLCKLWPKQCRDRLLFYSWMELYSDYVKVMEVCGESAIEKVQSLKKSTRSLYSTGIIRNCIHSPINNKEYTAHIKILQNQNKENKWVFHDLINSTRYLDDSICKELAKYIIDISYDAMLHATMPYENSNNRFRYYLIEDEIHSFTDYVCFIYECFSEFDYKKSCVLATILKAYGEVCLVDANEEKSADTLIDNGVRHNMIIQRHEIVNSRRLNKNMGEDEYRDNGIYSKKFPFVLDV